MKKLIIVVLTLCTICCTAWVGESNIAKTIIKEFNVITDPCKSDPEPLKVIFDSGVSVDMGNEILPSQAKRISVVDWNADENTYYTILCIDPDAPSPGDPNLGEALIWLVGNIPKKAIDLGEVLVEYVTPSPPKGAQLNRVIFLLYKQPSLIKFDEKLIDKYTLDGRTNFSSEKFSTKYSLGNPIAFNFYLTKYDSFVLEMYKQLNCCFELNSPEIQYT